MVLQPKIPALGSQNVVSYNYSDLASGLGYETFHAGTTVNDGSTTVYNLTPFTYSSDTQYSDVDTTGLKFDTSVFNLPKTLKGTAFVEIPMSTDGRTPATVKEDVTLYRVDTGDTEHEIGTGTSSSLGANSQAVKTVSIDCTETLIKKGEKLRFKIASNSGSTNGAFVAHDPNSSSSITHFDTIESTDLKVQVPFRINQ